MTNLLPRIPPTYPMNAFPLLIRSAGWELIQNVQAPDAMIGMGLINAISMSCQGLIDVKLPTGQIRPVSQNLLIVAESGERKSTVSSLLLKPFRDADTKALICHKGRLERYRAELEVWEARSKGLRSSIRRATSRGGAAEAEQGQLMELALDKPKEPKLRHFLRQDITAKAVMEALQGDGESIGITTDEGHALFKSEAMSHIGLLNRLWDSPEVLHRDRGDNESLVAMNPRVSVSIMTQHAPLKAFLDNRGSVAKGSGHWARYLVGRPQSTMGFRRVNTQEPAWNCLASFHARIGELLVRYEKMIESNAAQREVVSFSADAANRWVELATHIESLLRDGQYLSDINDFASKVMEILARLAAAMHYFSCESGQISLDTLERANEIVRWHVDEYKFLFSPQFVMPPDHVDAQAVAAYLQSKVWQGPVWDTHVLKNRVLRNGPVRVGSRLDAALDLLAGRGAIFVYTHPLDKKKYVQLFNNFFGQPKLQV